MKKNHIIGLIGILLIVLSFVLGGFTYEITGNDYDLYSMVNNIFLGIFIIGLFLIGISFYLKKNIY